MRLIAGLIFCLTLAAPQSSERLLRLEKPSSRRLALLIGNARYPRAPLVNPVNDVRAVSEELKELGFGVESAADVDLKTMSRTIDRFVDQLHPGDVGLFYYAGHGFQIEGENYLIPIDFDARDAADAKYEAYSAGRIIERMENSGACLNIAIFDACRNNPFRASRGASGGLASMNTGAGTFIAFATAPGKTAMDNPKGANGLFTLYLLEALKEPGLNLDDVFNQTREKVYRVSNGEQLPWVGSSVIGKFYFRSSETASSPSPLTFGKLVNRTPKSRGAPPGPSLLKTALMQRAEGKLQESLDTFTRAVKQDPREAQVFFERGKLYASLDQFDAAISDFSEALRLEADNAAAYHARGVAYLGKRDYQKALGDLNQAASRLPRDASVFFHRAIAFASMSRYAQAIENYTQALNIRPDYAGALVNRAIAYASSGKYQDALQDCNEALRLQSGLGGSLP